MRKRRNPKEIEEIKKEIVKLRKRGLTYEEIGKRVKMSRQRIHQLIKNYNPKMAGVKALEKLFGIYEGD